MRASWTGAAVLLLLLGAAPAVAEQRADEVRSQAYRHLEVDGQRYDLTAGARSYDVRTSAADDVRVEFVHRDRDGAATTAALTLVLGVDNDVFRLLAPGPDGRVTTSLPKGHYHVDSIVDTPRPGREVPSTSVLVTPDLAVSQDREVVVDAGVAKPVSVTVPDPRAVGLSASVAYRRHLGRGPAGVVVGTPDVTALYTAHTGPAVPGDGFAAVVGARFARPGPTGGSTDSPVVYATGWRRDGTFFTGFRHAVAEGELAEVRAEHDAVARGRRATKTTVVDLPPFRFGGDPVEYTSTPFTRVERYAGDTAWANVLEEHGPEDRANPTTQTAAPVVHRPGRRSVERWNRPPARPAARVVRLDDVLVVEPALHGDDAGHEGTSAYRRAHLELSRDGVLIGDSPDLGPRFFAVPPEPATYRLAAEAERDFADLAPRTSAIWTFTSAAGWVGSLPSVRHEVRGPVLVAHVPALRSLEVDVSHDGGRTWLPLALTGAGDRRTAVLRHSTGPVSLRAKASDRNGGTVEQITIDAFRQG
ncbi:hypothetical protein ACFFQW_06620 [Umezawaea endophytica]|uniref:Uncharacterized protein n=1 Tax=Umezawaea endophytica TaxID=1654476 RepID=A0A9X2VRT0_9PSEU|nr:hypothetical protein [Umezawaea endophytica]MCS7480997.1 hypothetical protein [Umezawaea endophytica]